MACLKKCSLIALLIVTRVCTAVEENQLSFPTFDSRLILLFQYDSGPCSGRGGLSGTCYPLTNCLRLGGRPDGLCSRRLAVCCVMKKTCNESSSAQVVNFVNPGYPREDTSSSTCLFNAQVQKKSTCQLRIDLEELQLPGPSGSRCEDGAFTVRPNPAGSLGFRSLCGNNTGQHLYIPVDTSLGPQTVQLVVSTTRAATYRWNIRVTQIDCQKDPQAVAPPGCLQYHTRERGSFESFGHGGGGGGGYVGGLSYAVCVRRSPQSCGVRYAAAAGDFRLSAAQPALHHGDEGCDPPPGRTGTETTKATDTPENNESNTSANTPSGTTATSSMATTSGISTQTESSGSTPAETESTTSAPGGAASSTTAEEGPASSSPTPTGPSAPPSTAEPATTQPAPTELVGTSPTTVDLTTVSSSGTPPAPSESSTPSTSSASSSEQPTDGTPALVDGDGGATGVPTTVETAGVFTTPPAEATAATELPGGSGGFRTRRQQAPPESHDFVYIPDGQVSGSPGHVSKMCGEYLASHAVTSTVPGPFMVWFHSDDVTSGNESGFKITYEQLSIC